MHYNLSQKHLWLKNFEILRSEILNGHDKLKENYSTTRLNLDQLDDMSVIIDHESDQIVAFSSIFTRPTWKNHCRILNRLYYHPSIRNHVLQVYNPITQLMLDYQISQARYLGKKSAFISRSYPSIRWCKKFVSKALYPFHFDDNHLYNTCDQNNKDCWQHLLIHQIDEQQLPLLKITVAEFKNMFF